MITINSNGRFCIPDEDVFIGFAGDNLNVKREFFLEGVTDSTTIYRMYLLFDDGTSNFFLLDKELTETGTKLIWDIESDQIFKSGIVILQIKGTNNQGKIFHTCQTSLVVQKSIEFSESYNTIVNSEFLQHEEDLNDFLGKVNSIKAEAETLYEKIKDADIDSTPTENSDSPVASGGVYSSLKAKLDDTDNSVKSNNLADGAVTSDKLSDNVVTTEKIVDNAVSSSKIMDRAVGFSKLDKDTMIDTSSNSSMAYALASDSHIPTTGFVKVINEGTKEKIDTEIAQVNKNIDNLFVKKELLVNLSSFKDESTGDYKNVGRYYYSSADKIVGISNDSNYACIPIELKAGLYSVENINPYYSFYLLNNQVVRFGGAENAFISTTFELPIDTTLYVSVRVTASSAGHETVAIASGDTIPEDISTLGVFSYDTAMELDSVKKLSEKIPTLITVKKDGTGDFSTLKEAVDYSRSHSDLTIQVYEGTYDLIEEFGEEYFTNLSGTSQRRGLQIGNGVHLIFSSGSKVVCHYQGNNETVKTCFSPFNCIQGTKGFTLENLTLEASNVRYAIHDEAGSSTLNMYRNTYKNCKITIDNSNNEVWKHHQCIGGGLGLHGEIIIENCSFTDMYNVGSKVSTVSYHNVVSEGAKSRIILTGCYFSDNATFSLAYYGNSTEVTEAYVSNCSMTYEPYVTAETSEYTTENVKLISWNNEIRNL